MCGKTISSLYEQLARRVQIDLGIGDGGVAEKCRQHRQPNQRVLARLIERRQCSGRKGMAEVMDTRRPALYGAHRCTLGERLDCAVMRWVQAKVEAVLHLRCIELNGDWEKFVPWFHRKTQACLNKDKRRKVLTNQPLPLANAA